MEGCGGCKGSFRQVKSSPIPHATSQQQWVWVAEVTETAKTQLPRGFHLAGLRLARCWNWRRLKRLTREDSCLEFAGFGAQFHSSLAVKGLHTWLPGNAGQERRELSAANLHGRGPKPNMRSSNLREACNDLPLHLYIRHSTPPRKT